MPVTRVISLALISFGPVASKTNFLDPSESNFIAKFLHSKQYL